MNLSVTKGPIGISELAYSTTAELPVECDVMLPDYCPDIVRVLSCQANATLTDTAYTGGRLNIEGVVGLKVLYLSEVGGVRKCEYKLPYTKSIDMKAVDGQPIVTATAETSYINCRAVSPRRLDIRGAVSIAAKMWLDKEEEAVTSADGEGIQLKIKEMDTSRIIGRMNQHVTQQEDLEIPFGKSAPTHVIRASGFATVSECRPIGGRVVIKGELALRICYATDDICTKHEVSEYILPISQIVEAPAAAEDCTCECWLGVCGIDVEVAEDPAGAAIFEVEAHMMAKMVFLKNQTISVATDCYSTHYPCEGRMKRIPVAGGSRPLSEKQPFRAVIDVGDELESFSDVWVKPDKIYCQPSADGSLISGKIIVGILGSSGDSNDYRERSTDFSMTLPIKLPNDFVPDIGLSLPSAHMTAIGEMELKCDIHLNGMSSDGGFMEALVDINMDTSAPFETDPAVGMRIYFAERGESVWDIAKRYHTSESMIINDNALDTDHMLERKAIIIPSV